MEVQCPCGGNERCVRCYGRGYIERAIDNRTVIASERAAKEAAQIAAEASPLAPTFNVGGRIYKAIKRITTHFDGPSTIEEFD